MLSMCTRLATQVVNTTIKSSARTLYSAHYLRLDNFQSYSERIRQENASNSNAIKQGIHDAVAKPEGKIFTEDLKSYLYHVQTDEEINTLIEAIKKYHQQASLSLFSFNFNVPLMRLLYIKNKTDKAIDLYMKEKFFEKSLNVTVLLLNKLVEEKRFDDLTKIATKYLENLTGKSATPQEVGTGVSSDALKLISEAMLLKNDPSALEYAVKFLKRIDELKLIAPSRCVHQIVLLALDQNKPDTAFEIIQRAENQNTTKLNLKILTLIGMNRVEEAVKQAEELMKINSEEKKTGLSKKQSLLFFPTTIEKLIKATENDAQLKPRVQTIADTAKAQNLVLATDLRESLTRVVDQSVRNNTNNQNNNRQNLNRINQQRQQGQQQQPRRNINNNNTNANNNNYNNQNRQSRTMNNAGNQQSGQRRPQDQQQQDQQTQRFQNQRRV